MKDYNNMIMENSAISCEFCNSVFSLKRNLVQHLKTNKKCLSNRPKTTYDCVWCNRNFITKNELNIHYKKCDENKEQLHIDLLNKHNYMIGEKDKQLEKIEREKNNQLEEKDKIIKDLQDKLYSLANKTTINNTTKNYTVNLTCAKPFILSRKRIVNLLKTTCNEKYMLQGEIGLAKWFIDHACRNNEGKVALQTTDYRRKILKYIDEREDTKQITGNNLQTYMTKCLNDYRKTPQYNAIADKILERYKDSDFSKLANASEFMHPNRKFINHICDETYEKFIEDDESSDEDIDDPIYDDITDEEPPTITVEPCFKEHFKERPYKLPERSTEYDKFYD
jgi:hypothetical protein